MGHLLEPALAAVIYPTGAAGLILFIYELFRRRSARSSGWAGALAVGGAVLAAAAGSGSFSLHGPMPVLDGLVWLIAAGALGYTAIELTVAGRFTRAVFALAAGALLGAYLVAPLYPHAIGRLGASLWISAMTAAVVLTWPTLHVSPGVRRTPLIAAPVVVVAAGIALVLAATGSSRAGQIACAAGVAIAVVAVAARAHHRIDSRAAVHVGSTACIGAITIGHLYGALPLAAALLLLATLMLPQATIACVLRPFDARSLMRVGAVLVPMGGAAAALVL